MPTPTSSRLPARCPRCGTASSSWAYIGNGQFLCGVCYLKLTSDREPVNLLAPAVETVIEEVRQRKAEGTR
jgi:hypothetical protein